MRQMVIASPVPGQEERNSDNLLDEGVTVKCNDLVTLAASQARKRAYNATRSDLADRVVIAVRHI
jgi:hypothetical protein